MNIPIISIPGTYYVSSDIKLKIDNNINAIHFEKRYCDNEIINELATVLSINTNITSLNVSLPTRCHTIPQLTPIFEVLQNNLFVKSLKICHHNCLCLTCPLFWPETKFFECLQCNKKMTTLQINCTLDINDLCKLFEALQYNETIKSLILRCEDMSIDESQQAEIISYLGTNRTLSDVEVDFVSWGRERGPPEITTSALFKHIKQKVKKNKRMMKKNVVVATVMLMIRKQHESIIAQIPRRLLIYLLSFL